MTRLQFHRIGAHYYFPVNLNVGVGGLFVPNALVDTGATKCSVPVGANNTYLHLPVIDRDQGVRTATSLQGLEVIRIPKIVVMLEMANIAGQFQETDIQEQDVETWLSDDQIIIGMNLLNKIDLTMKRSGDMTVEK